MDNALYYTEVGQMDATMKEDIKQRIQKDFETIANFYGGDASTITIKIHYVEPWLLQSSGRYVASKNLMHISIPDNVEFVKNNYLRIRKTLTHECIHHFEKLHHDNVGYKVGFYSGDKDVYTILILAKIWRN
ncbi:hypothetical protein [Sulfuricurvum sp.]|uniref:hypothetical protein n=1 Tax=Sulfuricurvum sp. TaxID=2025608 RepID=UPI0035689CEC